jgi:hypothetical protein
VEVTPAELHERMSRLSSSELSAIVSATDGDYTPEAVAAARAEFASRPLEDSSSVDSANDESRPLPSSLSLSIRALGAIMLLWVGWVFVALGMRLVLSLRPSGVVIGVLLALFGGGLFWVARRISVSWRRLVVVVPLFLGAFAVFRGVVASLPDVLTTGVLLVLGSGATYLVLRIAARRHATYSATAG